MELRAEEFLRRFLLHVAPPHFVRIRHFGLLANRTRQAKLARCRQLLAVAALAATALLPPANHQPSPPTAASASPILCPACGVGRLRRSAILAPQRGIPP
jgi:hypothetical protein